MLDEFESAIYHANYLHQLREAVSTEKDVVLSLRSPIDLLKSIFTHLELKGQAFDLYEATTVDDIH